MTRRRTNKEQQSRNAESIANKRAEELNRAMYVRNEVRRTEADARERKLREKELMIAHMQQRADDREGEEVRKAQELQDQLDELERQEYELLVALEGHKSDRMAVHEQLEKSFGDQSPTKAPPLA